MKSPWTDEAIRQLRLAVLWACSARPQSQGPDEVERARALFQRIREEVINPSLALEWVPGVSEQVRRIQRHLRDLRPRGPAETASKLIDRIEARFASAFGSPPSGKPASAGSLKLALQFAVDNALNQVDASSGTAGWGNLGDPSSSQPPPPDQAAAWLGQAVALIAWGPLRQEVDAQAAVEVNRRRMTSIVSDCQRLLTWLDQDLDRRKTLGPVPARLRTAAEAASRSLDDCSQAVARLREQWPEDDGQPARDPQAALRTIDNAILQGPGPWPPRLIRDFQEAVSRLDEARLGSVVRDAAAQKIPTDDASGPQLVLLALADRLAALGLAPDHPAWDELERLGKRLLDDPAELVEIVRAPRSGLARRDEVLADGQPPRVVTPGLVVSKGAERRIIRRGRIETPRRQADASILCQRLAESVRFRHSDLADLFDRVAVDLGPRPDLASAWSAIQEAPESLGRFWQAVQRAQALALEKVPAAADFLAELGKTFQFVEPSGKGPARDGWRIARDDDAREASPLSGAPRLALKGPDGTVVEPAGWLQVPGRWDSPLLLALESLQPLVGGLRALDPTWNGWTAADSLPWDLAYRGGGGRPGPIDPASARSAFEAVYDRAHRPEDPLAEAFRRLARGLYAGLVDSGIAFSPPLDRDTLRPEKATPGTRTQWVPGPAPAGTLLRVVRFGAGDQPGEVERSLGPDPSPEASAWAGWLGQGDDEEAVPILAQWRSELPELLGQPDQLRARSQAYRDRFRPWVGSEAGAAAFDRLASRSASEGPARALLSAIQAAGWAESWPRVGPDGLAVWPEGSSSRSAPGVRWVEMPDVPIGRSPAGRFQRATAPELVRGEFSLGRLAADSPISTAAGLVQAARTTELAEAAQCVLFDEIDQALGLAEVPRPSSALAALLDAIIQTGRSRTAPAEALDEILNAARRWARSRGLAILPASWSFVSPPDASQLAREGVSVSDVLFLDGGGAGQVRLGALGFSAEGEATRPPKLAISAGPAPSRYVELCDQVHDAETDWPQAARFRQELEEWPAARIDGEEALRFAAERSFGTFWDLAGPPPRPALVEEIGRTLSRVLAENFELTTFEPVSLRDFGRDWITVNEYGPDKSHRVKRLIRPGLRTPTDVSYPAVVDVE